MGCDIHMYVEHREKGATHWNSFGGRINPGRDYGLFGRIAGVRTNATPVAPVRGFPDDAGYHSGADNFMYIVDSHADEEGFCSRESAESWAQSGLSYIDGDRCSHPDWHSHTWLTTKEFAEAIKASDTDIEYHALLAAMCVFEKKGYEARVVIWFDN